jgi:hypothetical protein
MVVWKYRFLIVLICSIFAGCSSPYIRPTDARIKLGDPKQWQEKNLDDQRWTKTNGTDQKGIFVIRFHFNLPEREKNRAPFAVQIVALGAYQAFWDGSFIGDNGKAGNSKEKEIPGYHTLVLPLPDSLNSSGNHVLSLRISNFHYQREYSFFNASVGNYHDLIEFPIKMAMMMAVLAGAFLIGGAYYLFMFSQHRSEKLYLVFSLVCILFLCLLVAEYLPVIWAYSYPFQVIRLEIIGILGLGIAILIPYFLNRQFAVFDPKSFNLLMIVVLFTIFGLYHGRYDLTSQLMGIMMGIAGLVIALGAIYKKTKGGWLVFSAITLGAIASVFLYYDYSLYLGFGFLLLAMLRLLSLRSKAIEQAYQKTLLLSERLKTELLKKSIQPHFLMNTLTALSELIEHSPKEGSEMINALANEFEILSEMADETLVPIDTEIKLCKEHLRIMHFRKGVDYRWQTEGINKNEYLPPAVIHTLLENGITHSKPLTDRTVRFHLSFRDTIDAKIYEFRTHALNRYKTSSAKNGTGMNYIEARLRESYGNQWSIKSAPVEGGWLSSIIIKK